MTKLFFKDGTTKTFDMGYLPTQEHEHAMKEMVNGNNEIVKIEVEVTMTQTFNRGEW